MWIAMEASFDPLRNRDDISGVCEEDILADPYLRSLKGNDISLRQWLDKPGRSVDALECLHIFRQIVEIVSIAHAQGIVVHNVRPSCFVMSSFNHVTFIESASCSDSGSDSLEEDGLSSQMAEVKTSSSPFPSSLGSEGFRSVMTPVNALSETSCMQSSSVYAAQVSLNEGSGECRRKDSRHVEETENKLQSFPMKQILAMETTWYTSPEEASDGPSSSASDIYRLGVLLFELFCSFSSREGKSRIMSSLRHRVLPPQLLLKWPKEASFCLWLLHPDPSNRPKLSELLQSEFLNESKDELEERETAIELRKRIEEQDLLLEFLLLMQQRKQEAARKLQDTISFLCSDIEQVMRHQTNFKKKIGSHPDLSKDNCLSLNLPSMTPSAGLGSRKRFRPGILVHDIEACGDNVDDSEKSSSDNENEQGVLFKSSRLMKNFKKLELAYLLMRGRVNKPSGRQFVKHSSISSDGRGSVVLTERSSVNNLASKESCNDNRQGGWISPFLEGLCKYLSFSKLKVKADLKQGDLLNSSNLVCSLSFDRDGEFFATAGVNRKIKVFGYDSIVNEDRDIHYPVVEMASRSKLSSVCWNRYIKSQIASSNFEGVVQVWDVTRSQVVTEMGEHERRVWSIDFSSADPTILASGSDDGSVKLWSINQAILFLHLVDVSFETKRFKYRHDQNESQCLLCTISCGFWSVPCIWFS
ncbi:protein SPA1-RELATED 3-like isoform X2 [Cucurbita pepo subsp. pepo]|uniref:protein SPA1-RELATED 3-like isoform X2 n=1 Tax=Cucurbita pepo subsp. pepo TaxID=3664 RepID=UPI000C9D5949|nr:protein SPA1-RELATED 3-like isoform X2 [Cucurbita pepo subsp. pepo]